MILFNVALEIEFFPVLISKYLFHYPCKDNRPPVTDLRVTLHTRREKTKRFNYSLNIHEEEDGDRQRWEPDSMLDIM